jgi:PHD/YefM family antitoxin component YafN of YafNO toxin-antitoxin module
VNFIVLIYRPLYQANKLEETIREYLKQEQDMKHHLTALGEIKNQLSRNEVSHWPYLLSHYNTPPRT